LDRFLSSAFVSFEPRFSFEKAEKEKKEAEKEKKEAEKEKKEAEKRLDQDAEREEEKENEEEKNCSFCLPLCPNNPGVEYEDGVRLFWSATRKINCQEKLAKKDGEKGNQEGEAGKVVKKVEYKVEKESKEEGVSLLPINSA